MKKEILKKRIIGFLIDFFFLTVIEIVISKIVSIEKYMGKPIFVFYVMLVSIILILIRDVLFFGRSLGKRILKLLVVDRTDESDAPIWKLVLRNITTPIWFVDLFRILKANEEYRMMDKLLKLDVVNQKTSKNQQPKTKPEKT